MTVESFGMMRKSGLVGVLAILVTVLDSGGLAMAKGSTLRFERESYAPGETAIAHATVEVWPTSGQPEDGPYAVYVVRGRQPLWYGHLPNKATRVGELDTGELTPTRTSGPGESTFDVGLTFEVPNIRDGRYAVWVCRRECGANSGFGDLVYGSIVISSSGTEAVRGPVDDDAGEQGATAGAADLTAWVAAAFAIAVAAIGIVVMRRRPEGRPTPPSSRGQAGKRHASDRVPFETRV